MQSMARPGEEFGKDHGLVHEAVVTGRKVGAGAAFWAKLAHDEALFGKVVEFVAGDGVQPTVSAPAVTVSRQRAREIVGKNIFGVEEAITHYGANPTEADLAALATVPYTEAELKECRLTHVLTAVFPTSVNDIRAHVAAKRLFYPQSWYNKLAFATNTGGDVCWRLIRKTKVSKSTNKTWAEQQELLGKDEDVPTVRELVYMIIGHFLATGERLFGDVYVRTQDISDGHRVYVGFFDADGLGVNGYWLVDRYDNIGCSSARKSVCR